MYRFKIMVLIGLLTFFTFGRLAEAATYLDWDVTFEGKSVDVPRSAADLGGFDSWSSWTYKVKALTDTGSEPGEFTHLGIGLPLLPYITDTALIAGGIEDSAEVLDAGLGDVTSSYDIELREGGGPLGSGLTRHLLWNNLGNLVITTDDFNFFSFSTPDAAIETVDLGIKQGGTRAFGDIEGPGELLRPTSTVIPEPSTLILASIGLLGIRSLRRFKR